MLYSYVVSLRVAKPFLHHRLVGKTFSNGASKPPEVIEYLQVNVPKDFPEYIGWC